MRIRQAICLKNFQDNFFKKFDLEPYRDRTKPVVVFGLFNQPVIDFLADKHQSLAVLVWIGSDALYMRERKFLNYDPILHSRHVHIAISRCVSDDLSARGIPHIYVPITHVPENDFEPVPLGEKIYCYCNFKRPSLYGRDILLQVIEAIPDTSFIIADNCYKYPYEQMKRLYSECFIGLRPTRHDGQPTTVIELGLMGRRCIHNGDAPNTIHWRTVEDIIAAIKDEQRWIRHTNSKIAEDVKRFIDIGTNWLNTNFYQ
jgi:hypothetical protein